MVTKISICIPRLDRFSSRKTIHNVLEKYKLGSINRIDIVGWGEVRRAFIHFESWNETHPPAKNILDRLNKMEKVNIIHSFPWYWRCMKSRVPCPSFNHQY